jgi:hypothetical protein
MRIVGIFAVALMGGCTHADNGRFCTDVAIKQYSEYREHTDDDPPLRAGVIKELIAKCLNDLG